MQIDELKSLLLHCNLKMENIVLDNYMQTYFGSQTPSEFNFQEFLELFLLILRNQNGYFRQIYAGKKQNQIDIHQIIKAME